MKKRSALQFRQEFGALIDEMGRGGEPILIEKSSAPVAVVIPYELFRQRFIEHQSNEMKLALIQSFRSSAKPAQSPTLDILRELRYGRK
jgi:prevent-host-death family protein